MDNTYAKRKAAPTPSAGTASAPEREQTLAPVTSLRASAEIGNASRIDLSDTIRAKMEHAFGMDLGAVKLYESASVAEHGAEAVAQGDTIAFAPGKHDFGSRSGQERLGHELSHVASQRRGEVTGSGFLNSPALEARADREGAMAAAGGQIYDGPVTGPMSGAVADAATAGPIQAFGHKPKKPKEPEKPQEFIGQKGVKQAERFFGSSKGGNVNQWRKDLSDGERTALEHYTRDWNAGGSYYMVNLALRMIPDGTDLDKGLDDIDSMSSKDRESLRGQIKAMDSAISKSELQKPIVLHRGSDASLLGGETDPDEIMEKYGGRIVKDRGFTSTSAVRGSHFVRQMHYVITVPPGKGRGAFIKSMSLRKKENEFLLKRDSRFLIKNAYESGGQTYVEMEVQDPEELSADPSEAADPSSPLLK